MKHEKLILFFFIFVVISFFSANACTIVAVSGSVTVDGRPLLLKTRDGHINDIKIKIGCGCKYDYLCQTDASDGNAYSGYNEAGFSIVNSHSYNMPNPDYDWNAYLMQLALERCATVDEFDFFLDTITKPIPVRSNYGVIDNLGNVAIFEVNAYGYVRYDADSSDCGYLIRANFSFSQDTTTLNTLTPTSIHRYQIASAFLEETIASYGFITKEHLIGLSRCLVNDAGEDLKNIAPYDENTYTPVEFRYYIPRYISISTMIIQGVLPDEQPNLTVAWTMLGPQMTTVCVPYLITPRYALPQKAQLGDDGHSWFCYMGQQLNNSCFIDNATLDLAKLYNLCGTGVMQKICNIEEAILDRGNVLMDKLRNGEAHCYDVESYYAWVDDYVEEQYEQNNLLEMNPNAFIGEVDIEDCEIEYYDVMGRRVNNVIDGAIIKRSGKIAIVLN